MRTRLIVFVTHLFAVQNPSGVPRVTLECIRGLCRLAYTHIRDDMQVSIATWDPVRGALRHCSQYELDRIFADRDDPERIVTPPLARHTHVEFANTLPGGEDVCVLMPEVFHLVADGNEIHARVISQSIDQGWRTAAIYYDKIPCDHPFYWNGMHEEYLASLLRLDHILSISKHSQIELMGYYAERGVSISDLEAARQRHQPVLLPGVALVGSKNLPRVVATLNIDSVVMFGTVEPRKRQVAVVRAFSRMRIGVRSGLVLKIFGNLHPGVAAEFNTLVDADQHVQYLGFVDDKVLADELGHALFTVFASEDEGFGLPIVESLAHGVAVSNCFIWSNGGGC